MRALGWATRQHAHNNNKLSVASTGLNLDRGAALAGRTSSVGGGALVQAVEERILLIFDEK